MKSILWTSHLIQLSWLESNQGGWWYGQSKQNLGDFPLKHHQVSSQNQRFHEQKQNYFQGLQVNHLFLHSDHFAHQFLLQLGYQSPADLVHFPSVRELQEKDFRVLNDFDTKCGEFRLHSRFSNSSSIKFDLVSSTLTQFTTRQAF